MRARLGLSGMIAIAMASVILAAGTPPGHSRPHRSRRFVATAYCKDGETQSGIRTHPGIVAADPHVLPTGSIVRVDGPGVRSATYVVEDRGVTGRHVDIFMRSCRAAKHFGRRHVLLRVLKVGDGQRLRSDGR